MSWNSQELEEYFNDNGYEVGELLPRFKEGFHYWNIKNRGGACRFKVIDERDGSRTWIYISPYEIYWERETEDHELDNTEHKVLDNDKEISVELIEYALKEFDGRNPIYIVEED